MDNAVLRFAEDDAAPAPVPELMVSEEPHGFWYLWLKYVSGFDIEHHCQRCLAGKRSQRVRLHALTPKRVVRLDEARTPFLYLCGGAGEGYSAPGPWSSNLHLAVRPKDGAVAEATSYNGTLFRIRNAERVEIPDLPKGWRGLPDSFTTCRNFRFGVAHFFLSRPERPAGEEPGFHLA